MSSSTNGALVNSDYRLQKFPGKGGWTFAEIPGIKQDRSNPFGWVTVRGSIDGFELRHYKLMPMGNGKLFLPVKAAIRKVIKKEAGDWVRVILYPENSPPEIPQEIMACFNNEPPSLYQTFLSFTDSEKKAYIDWIYTAKRDITKTSRIVKMMERLEKGLKLYDP